MNLAALAGLPSRSIEGVWYRAIDPQHLPAALSYSHTRRFASRYYEGPTAKTLFDIVYLAENPLVALFEVEALFGSPLTAGGVTANPARSWVIINAQVRLTKVADLTDVSASHSPLSTTAQELTGDWKGYRQRNGHERCRAGWRRTHTSARRGPSRSRIMRRISCDIRQNAVANGACRLPWTRRRRQLRPI
jgi:hypothetical protein